MIKEFAPDEIFSKKRLMPTKIEHCIRNTFNKLPESSAMLCDSKRKKAMKRVFVDDVTGFEWVLQPWYLTMFHNPAKNCKFLLYEGLGTSEVILPKVSKMKIDGFESFPCDQILGGSYNYRAHGVKHWLADVLPVALYWKMIS